MRIVSVMTGAAPGGAEFAAVELLDALIGRGHQAVMLSDSPGIGRETRVEVHHLELGPKLSRRSWPALAARWPWLKGRLRRALEAEQPYDLLLLHYKKEQLLAPSLPPHLRPRIAWAEWGPVPRQLRHGLGQRMYAAAAREADPVLAISAGTRDSVIAAGVDPAAAVVLPNAMRTDEIGFSEEGRARVRGELGIPAEAFTVGCISRFHPKKRNDVLIDAVGMLGDDAHLILAGSGETEGQLRQRAAPLGDRAHFLTTPGGEIGDVLSACDVSVFCPSPTEGQPRAVILGMLAARPCVSTGAEGVADMIEDAFGAIVDPENDPSALAAVLRRYEGDPERVRREGEIAARRAVERFDSAAVAKRAEELLEGRWDGARSAGLPIRIVSVMTGSSPGGAEFAAVELLDAMVSHGHQAVMLSDWAGISRDTRVPSRPLEMGPKLSRASFPGLLITWPLRYLRLRRALEAERPYDVLLLHFKKEQLLASLLPRKLRATLVWAEWGPVPRQLRHGIANRLYAGAARRAAAVLAISENTRASVVGAGIDRQKVTVVPNAIRTAKFGFSESGRASVRDRLGIPAGDFVVGCTSRFHPKKRNGVAIDAVARMGDDVHLVLAGEGDAEGDLRAQAAPLGGRVHFLPTPGTDAGDLFSAFDVSVFCPSPTEGSPTAVILGMLAGRPCVASAAEGVADLIDDECGTVVSPENDPDALAAVLREYAGDPERTRREGAIAARRASERFEASTIAAQVERLLGAAMREDGR